MRKPSYCSIYMAAIIIILNMPLKAYDWPVYPDSSVHRLGNSYGEFQCYGSSTCSPYMHPGIDILIPYGTPVFACRTGYVKAIMTISFAQHWRVIIGDSSGTAECNALMYAHLDKESMISSAGLAVGDYVEAGQYIGNIVFFQEDFHHLHFAQIRHSGDSASWADDDIWEYSVNTLDSLDGIYDNISPVFEYAYSNKWFAICSDNTASYLNPDLPISGNVDLVCKVSDRFNHNWKLTPYQIEYSIEGDSSIPWTNSVCFNSSLGTLSDNKSIVDVIYKKDAVCFSEGDYEDRDYYIILTNTDGDSLIEPTDQSYSWMTPFFHNGDYLIRARAKDKTGNSSETSMSVTVTNYFELSGIVTIFNGDNGNAGAIITAFPDGVADTTDINGNYSIPNVGGGIQTIIITCPGCSQYQETVMMSQNQTIDTEIEFIYLCGDANGNGLVNILDVTHLISYLYKDGPAPVPHEAGDANGNGLVNILDVTYLIGYLYKDGPDPICPPIN